MAQLKDNNRINNKIIDLNADKGFSLADIAAEYGQSEEWLIDYLAKKGVVSKLPNGGYCVNEPYKRFVFGQE